MKMSSAVFSLCVGLLGLCMAQSAFAVTVNASDHMTKIIGDASGQSRLGYSTTVKGDFDGDGHPDMLVNYADNDGYTSKALLYYGSVTGFDASLRTTDADATFFSDPGEGYDYGLVVASAGDVNGDGYDDMLIADYFADSVAGKISLVYGSATRFSGAVVLADLTEDTQVDTFSGEASGDYAGTAIAGVGDVDNDGFDDFAIGAHWNDSHRGAVYLMYGSATPYPGTLGITNLSAADAKFTGENVNDYAGEQIVGGDFNGDTYSDIAIGDPRYSSYTGRVYVIYGQTDRLGVFSLSDSNAVIRAEEASDALGASLAVANVNGDVYDDLLIGSSEQSAGAIDGGAYLLYGGSSEFADGLVSTVATTKFTVAGSDGTYAFTVGAGDLNADAYDDIILATPSAIGASTSVFYGASSALAATLEATTQADVTIAPDVAVLGQSISVADVNGDGFGDMFLGSPSDDDGGDGAGAIYQVSLFVDADHDDLAGTTGAIDGTDCNDADSDLGLIQTYYADVDEDGLGDAGSLTASCTLTAPAGYVANTSDLNDDDHDNDGVDSGDDCNDSDNEISALQTYYADSDLDTLGDPAAWLSVCLLTSPEGYVTNADDSNDDDFDNDNVDTGDDCDDADSSLSSLFTYYADADSDTFGDPSSSTSTEVCSLSAPEGYVTNSDDADDTTLGGVNALTNNDGVVSVYYDSGFVQEITPFTAGAHIKVLKSTSDATRWIAVNGKSMRIFSEGQETDRQKLFKKKSNGKSKLKVVSLYDGYDTVVYISSRGRTGRISVVRLSLENTLSTLHTKTVSLNKKNLKVRLTVKTAKHRLHVRFGAKANLSNTLWKVMSSGKLKSTAL